MLVRGLYRHFNSRAVACRGMPFCPCYLRVDLRPSPGLCCLCVGANTRTARDIRPQPARAKISAARLADPASGLPPWTRRSRPDGGTAATQRTGRPAGAGPHARLGRTTAPRRDFHHASTLARPWAATHAVPTAHHPRLRIAKRNACSASQSHAERRLFSLTRLACQVVEMRADRPFRRDATASGGRDISGHIEIGRK